MVVLIPAILWTLGALVAAIVISLVVNGLKGKKFAVLGEGHVGKTVLIKFLTEGVFSSVYKETVISEPTKKNVLHLGDLELRLRESTDVGGGQGNYGLWRDIFMDSDIVLYLFRLDRFESGKSIDRILQDVGQIERWIEQSSSEKKILIIGTFADKIQNLDVQSSKAVEKYRRQLCKNEIIERCIIKLGGSRKVPLLVGSMKNKTLTMKLVHFLIKRIVS